MEGAQRTVGDVMTHAVVAVGREASFKEIAETLHRWRVTALPVLEAEGRVIGVVSEADLLVKQGFRVHDPARFEYARLPEDLRDELRKAGGGTAEELMSTPAVTVHADATLAEAARTMARRRVKRLPVVDSEGLLRGIVSRGDLLKVYLRSDEEIAQEVRDELAVRLFSGQPGERLEVSVKEGVVTLSGTVGNTALVPLAARLAGSVEGVVNVEFALSRPASAGGMAARH